jgi:pimeloyl-ACP methyl ester carboxylesterase
VTNAVPDAGRLIEVGGERIHVVDTGRSDGLPLLLSSGLGGAWFDWQPTVDRLRVDHRVVCFDRPGLGASPAGHTAPNLRAEAGRLAALATWAGAPVVVLAHSVAAFHAEALARLEPSLVAGLVLVDPSCERDPQAGLRLSAAAMAAGRFVGALATVTGLAKVLGPWAHRRILRQMSRRGEVAPSSVVRSVYGRGEVLATVLAEYAAYREMAADLAELRTRRPFPEIPLVVLTALGDVRDPAAARRWAACHARLAGMSPYGRQVELPDDMHMVQLDRPDAVADAVADVTAQIARDVP